ncbi:MAG TPA: hypothetical protein VNG04_07450 [Candidatus Acidoferrum sp.]|nr:hypothetical protein [Candidatus Acidoferrum sp.]HXJ32354.1 hypothetical protein [Gemmatimonadales bacterium]
MIDYETLARGPSVVPLQLHLEALREADKALEAERDRRYAEVNIEREKALKIKETADLAALGLAREIQDYKDGKADNIREQNAGERHLYATKIEIDNLSTTFAVLVKPLSDYVAGQQGRTVAQAEGLQATRWTLGQIAPTVGMVLAVLSFAGIELARMLGH